MGFLFRLTCLGLLIAVAETPRPRARPTPGAAVALRTGDVVLQTSRSSRSALIQQASRSRYSHVGLVEVAPDGVFVIEAVQPVSRTPWAVWRARGVGGQVTVLRRSDASPEALEQTVRVARTWLGRPYDARYRWDDEALYCSELVVKAYARGAGIELGRMERVDGLALSPTQLELARAKGIDPAQTLVTPASIAESPGFEVVALDDGTTPGIAHRPEKR